MSWDAITRCALAIVSEATGPRQLSAAVAHARQLGVALATAGARSAITPSASQYQLTPRQRQIVEGVSHGLTNTQIATQVGVTVPTVTSQIHAVKRKLAARDRAAVAATALRLGLID